MVGLSDIPCVGKVVDRISDATVEAFFRGFRYLFRYKELVKVLDSEMEKVNIQDGRLLKKYDEERADGKIIQDHVLRWQEEVKQVQESAKEFSDKYNNRASWRCLKCLPIPKPVSRFQLGREAVVKAKKAIELVDSGKELLANEIAHLPPIESLPRNDAGFIDFSSRKYAYGELWKALIDEDTSLILSIYGMPGVGKTRMMEQICQEAMEKKSFNKVARANVGNEELDVIKIQNQIAGDLNCHLQSQDNKKSRASQLKNSLMNQGKILLIFDDVWSEIPLDDIIGTSFGENSTSKGSKILLTSRREYVCLLNKCKSPVHITTLTFTEAWDLFQNTVGTCYIDSLQDEALAKEVCTKCAGLPLLIRAVGKALRFMSHHVWKDALQKLEKGNFKNIAGIDPQVYACIKLSIDRLPEDARLCLFLCSLFPEDAYIHITTLIEFAVGSQLIPDGESTVRAMVDILTISSLLLNSNFNYLTKVHDIIRDVARSIAFTDSKYAFLQVRCSSRLPENASFSTSKLLRLDVESDDSHFAEDLVCTDLNTLWLNCNNHLQQFTGGFFSMFVNLGFLMLQNVQFLSENFSLQPLSKLNMVIFDNCDIRETDVSLFPKNLRSLCIWDCNLPSPLDLPNLKHLRKLDIQQKLPAVIMVPNAISSLSSLEELHIPNGFSFAGPARFTTPIMDEISKLTRLTSLKIIFKHAPSLGTGIFLNLLKYDISFGDRGKTEALPVSTRMINFGVNMKRGKAIQSLMERAEELRLQCTDVDVSGILNSNREAFTDLKHLSIFSCDSVEYIAKITQGEIQHSRQPQTSFSKLTILFVKDCSAMKFLFCNSVAKCLVQLQTLLILDCNAMEFIVMNEGTCDGEIINFSKLKRMELIRMQSLRGFYGENKEMHSGSPDNSDVQYQPLFDGMVAFPSLEQLTIWNLEVGDIWGKHCSDSSSFCKLKDLEVRECSRLESLVPVGMLHRFQNLESLNIKKCVRLRNVFPTCIARDLIHLQKLYIKKCQVMREIIGDCDQQQEEITDDHGVIVFPELRDLRLDYLRNLTSFWCYQSEHTNKVEFPSLVEFDMNFCGEINLEAIELGRDDSTCPLNSLIIRSKSSMQLPCKWKHHLYNLEILSLFNCWWHDLKSLCFPKLKRLTLYNWEGSALFTISGFRSLQQLQMISISRCGLLEDIVEDVKSDEPDGMDKEIINLVRLDSVYFDDLPKLKSFMKGANYKCYMPALKKVEVRKCGFSMNSKN